MSTNKPIIIKTKNKKDKYLILRRGFVPIDVPTVKFIFGNDCLMGQANVRLINPTETTITVNIWSNENKLADEVEDSDLETIVVMEPKAVFNTGALSYLPCSKIYLKADLEGLIFRIEANENGEY